MEAIRRGEGSDLEKEMIDKMHYQLQLISKEKDSYIEMWESATRELEKLQDIERERSGDLRHKSKQIGSLQNDLKKARHLAESLQLEIKKMRREHEKFLSTAQTQDQEIDSTRMELKKCKAELKANKTQVDEYRKNTELLQKQLKPKSPDKNARNTSSDVQKEELQTFVFEMETSDDSKENDDDNGGMVCSCDDEHDGGDDSDDSKENDDDNGGIVCSCDDDHGGGDGSDDSKENDDDNGGIVCSCDEDIGGDGSDDDDDILMLSAMIKEVGRLNSEKTNLEEQLETLQSRNSEMEKREFDAISHVRDSVQMVENSILERDQALLREQQRNQEASRLQEVINKLLMEAGKRTRDEVNSVRSQCNKNLQKLMEEIQYLEVEGAEKQAQLERAMREKSAVELELEKVYREGPSEIERVGLTFEELQKRIGKAERARDEASISCDNLSSTIKRLENKHEQDKAQSNAENAELRRRIKKLETESEEMSENRLHLVDEIDKLKREVLAAKQGRETAEHDRDMEIAAQKKKFEFKEKDFDLKLRGVEEMNRKSINDLRDMLNTQQKIGIQWKEETKSLTGRFEKTVSELRHQVSLQKKRNDELNNSLMDERQQAEQ
ncbi:hypothetical protein QZH41_020238, partial [Actinostola sp. cb2023]